MDEAIIDMLKNLLTQFPTSSVILEMCCALLNFKLEKSLNDGTAVQFWLFTMRATAPENAGLDNLKQLFLKFSGCLTMASPRSDPGSGVNSVANTIIKRDYIYIEFLKVA